MTNHTFDEFDNYRKEQKAEMTLEEKLHKELDWLEIKHIDADGIIRNILSIIQQEIADAKPKWISVKDRLPENVDDVLVFSDYGDHTDIWVSRVDKYWDNNSITHWMPLPESPKENT